MNTLDMRSEVGETVTAYLPIATKRVATVVVIGLPTVIKIMVFMPDFDARAHSLSIASAETF